MSSQFHQEKVSKALLKSREKIQPCPDPLKAVIEGDQTGQAGLAFHKPILAVPGPPIVLYMPHDGTEDGLHL